MDPNIPKSGSKVWLVVIIVVVVLLAAGGGYYWWTKTHTILTGGGDTISLAQNGGKAVKPANFPKDMPLYPKADYQSYTVTQGEGSSYAADTTDTPAIVQAWFKEQLPKAGWTIDTLNGNLLSVSNQNSTGMVNVIEFSGKYRITFSVVPKSALSAEDQAILDEQKELLKKMQGE